MKVILEQDITRCRDCFHVTNSSQLHDCAFTSAPCPTVWYCRKANGRYLEDEYKIAEWCPLTSEFDRWWKANIYSSAILNNDGIKQIAKEAWEAAKKI